MRARRIELYLVASRSGVTNDVSQSSGEGVIANPEQNFMKGFLNFFGMSAGGWIGWAIGAQVSIFTAFIVSMVGTGVGLFYT